jgi:hypothetical protein
VRIFAARNMPQASAAQRVERQAALQIALRAAADVPLEVMRLCARGLKHAETVAAHSSRAALSDAQLGVALLHAAFNGARSSLEGKITVAFWSERGEIRALADSFPFCSKIQPGSVTAWNGRPAKAGALSFGPGLIPESTGESRRTRPLQESIRGYSDAVP